MAKIVVINHGLAGCMFDLNGSRTTVGRLEDNTIAIADPSVSGHHAEIILRGNDIVVRDLASTNGTLINGERITEHSLKPGQGLRFGQVELKLAEGVPAGGGQRVSARIPKITSGCFVIGWLFMVLSLQWTPESAMISHPWFAGQVVPTHGVSVPAHEQSGAGAEESGAGDNDRLRGDQHDIGQHERPGGGNRALRCYIM